MTKKQTKPKRGRKTKYDPDFARQAELIVSESNLSIAKLCKLFKVKSRETIYQWMRDHKEFLDSIERGRDIYLNRKIKASLAKRATGYRYTETTKERIVDKETGQEDIVVTKVVSKKMPADVSAIKFWTLNRDSENWKDSKNVDITPTGNFGINWIMEKPEDDKK